MFNKFIQDTLDPYFATKSIPCGIELPDLNKKLAQYFTKTFDTYEKLFTIIKNPSSFYSRPQPLRHPLIFYYGHTACFYVNKLLDQGVLKQHVNEEFERMFAVGVDQNDWDDLQESHYNWPTLNELQRFRNDVEKIILDVIRNNNQKIITWESNMWALLMGIDHEKLHLETSAVIIRRLTVDEVIPRQWLKECPFVRDQPSKVPLNTMKTVLATDYLYDKTIDKADYYGWDSEFGTKRVKTKQFEASKMLVSNSEYLEFFLDDGYTTLSYWTDEGKKWLERTKVSKPVFWILKNQDRKNFENYYLKTLTREIPMPWDWPVEVNNLQARAFCQWKSQKTGKKLRLPTEDEYFAIRHLLKADYEDWKYQSVGNINMQFWCSPCPVDMFEIEGFCDIVGNVLQHTCTPMYPFDNFKIHPLYQDFTTPIYDSRHDTIKGGCFINTGNSASMYYRTGFRRHFYLFTGFRYVESDNPEKVFEKDICQNDESFKEAIQLNYLTKNSYVQKVVDYVNKNKKELGERSLVVGCSVGRLPLQFSKFFNMSFGIDYTARYFQMASRLLQKGELSYQGVKIETKNFEITQELLKKVKLYQMNPVNTDKNKINQISFLIVDGFNLKHNTIKEVIKNCFHLLKKGQNCSALIICCQDKNSMKDVQKEVNLLLHPLGEIRLKDCFDIGSETQQSKLTGRAYFMDVKMHDG